MEEGEEEALSRNISFIIGTHLNNTMNRSTMNIPQEGNSREKTDELEDVTVE